MASIDSTAYSHMLSSTSSLTSSHGSPSTPNITRTYKQASQLFLTRRVPEALQTLEPIIRPHPHPSTSSTSPATPDADTEANGHDSNSASNSGSTYGADGTASSASTSAAPTSSVSASHSSSSQTPPDASELTQHEQPPIATASRGARVKVWSLYISMLNSIVEMGPEEGAKAFGTASRWKELVKRTRDAGGVWDDVVRWGYGGNEAAVDAEVVANLATLLLAHAPSQRSTQAHLENYLSSTAGVPSATALASRIEQESGGGAPNGHGYANGAGPTNNGTSTPRDLGSRLKILEIYVLHVLPRNEEWDYAREFVHMSEVLDEERRDAFLTALDGLQEEHNVEGRKEKELAAQRQREQEAEEERKKREKEAAEQRQKEREQAELQEQQRRKQQGASNGTSGIKEGINELDYGVDKTRPNGSTKIPNSRYANGNTTRGSTSGTASKKSRSAAGPSHSSSSRPPPASLYRRATVFLAALQQSLLSLGVNISRHPVAVVRTLLFLLALVMALARQDVRARITRARDVAWDKVRRTVGMGVKVSYI